MNKPSNSYNIYRDDEPVEAPGVVKCVQFRYPLDRRRHRLVKRGLDVVVSLLVIVLVLSWLLPLLGLVVVLESPGGMFFKQERGGKNNGVFV